MIQIIEQTIKSLVTLEEAKKHLRINNSREDSTINSLIISASEMVEEFIDRIIFAKKLKYTSLSKSFYFFGDYNIESIDKVDLFYKGELIKEDAEFEQSKYSVHISEDNIDYDSISIEFSVATEYPIIPEAFKQAALLYVGDLFNNRQGIVIGRTAFNLNISERILRPYTKVTSL